MTDQDNGPLPEEGRRPILRNILTVAVALAAVLLTGTILEVSPPGAADLTAARSGGYGKLVIRRSGSLV